MKTQAQLGGRPKSSFPVICRKVKHPRYPPGSGGQGGGGSVSPFLGRSLALGPGRKPAMLDPVNGEDRDVGVRFRARRWPQSAEMHSPRFAWPLSAQRSGGFWFSGPSCAWVFKAPTPCSPPTSFPVPACSRRRRSPRFARGGNAILPCQVPYFLRPNLSARPPRRFARCSKSSAARTALPSSRRGPMCIRASLTRLGFRAREPSPRKLHRSQSPRRASRPVPSPAVLGGAWSCRWLALGLKTWTRK